MVPVPLFRLGPSRDEVIEGWPWLDQVVLDGDLIADLELELAEGVNPRSWSWCRGGSCPWPWGCAPRRRFCWGGQAGPIRSLSQ